MVKIHMGPIKQEMGTPLFGGSNMNFNEIETGMLESNYKSNVNIFILCTVHVTLSNNYLSLLYTESIIVPSEVPTRIAVGVARPSAQGQETTYKVGPNTICKKLTQANYKHEHSFLSGLKKILFFRNNFIYL